MTTDNSTKPGENYCIIYYDHTGKNRQVVHPTNHFDGNWGELVRHITRGNYHKYLVL